MPDFQQQQPTLPPLPQQQQPALQTPAPPQLTPMDRINQATQDLQKTLPNWVNSNFVTPYQTRLDQTLRYNDPNIGYNPMDANLEDKYAQAHYLKTFGNNLLQGGARFLGTAAEAIATIPLAVDAVVNKDFTKLYDNDLTNSIHQWFNTLDTTLPVYQTNFEQQHPILKYLNPLQPKALLGAFGNAFNNFGFTAGAIAGSLVEDAVVTAATGGPGLFPALAANGVQFTKMLARASRAIVGGAEDVKAALKTGEAVADAATAGEVSTVLRNRAGEGLQDVGSNINSQNLTNFDEVRASQKTQELKQAIANNATYFKIRDAAKYNLALLTSATAEASFEAVDVYHRGLDQLKQQYFEEYGTVPTGDDLQRIERISHQSANIDMGANIGFLYMMNRVNWGSLFKPTTQAFDEAITGWGGSIARTTVTKDAEAAVGNSAYKVISNAPETKIGKILLNGEKLYKIGFQSINEAIEEGSQFIMSEGSMDYNMRKYNAKHRGDVVDGMASFLAGVDKTFNTNEGWDNMMGGFVGGIFGSEIMHKVLEGRGQTSAQKQMQIQADLLNQASFNGTFENKIQEAAVQTSLAEDHKDAVQQQDKLGAKNIKFNMLYNWVTSGIRANSFDKRMEELDAVRDLQGKSFQDYWGKEDNAENRAEVNGFLDNLQRQANNIKDVYTRIDRLTKNPYDQKANPLDHEAYNSYKDQLALNIALSDNYRERINDMQTELHKVSPLMDIQKAVNLTSIAGLRDTLKGIDKAQSDLAEQIQMAKEAKTDPELTANLINKHKALTKLFAELQPLVIDSKTGEQSNNVTEAAFDGKKYVDVLQKLYALHDGSSFLNNKYINKFAQPAIHINQEGEAEVVSHDELAEHLQTLQDIYSLSKANLNVQRFYNFLRKGAGATEFMDTLKRVNLEQLAKYMNKEGEIKSPAELQDEIEQDIRFKTPEPENVEEATKEERDIITQAAKKIVSGDELTDKEKNVTTQKPQRFAHEVKIQEATQQQVNERFGEQAEPTTDNTIKPTVRSKIKVKDLFGMFSQDHNTTKNRSNLYKAIFKSPEVFSKLTATYTKAEPQTTFFKLIPNTKIFRSEFKDNITIFHNGQPIGILRPQDSLWLDEGKRTIYDMTPEEFTDVTGHPAEQYQAFMDELRAYQTAYNNFKQALINSKDNVALTFDDINKFFDLSINTGAAVQNRYTITNAKGKFQVVDPKNVVVQNFNTLAQAQTWIKQNNNTLSRYDTLLKDLNYKPKGTALISFVNNIDLGGGTTVEPNIVNKDQLTQQQLSNVISFLANNADHFKNNANRYVVLLPIDNQYSLKAAIFARNADATHDEQQDYFNKIKQVASGLITGDKLNDLINDLYAKYFVANQDRTVKQTFITTTFSEDSNLILSINNPSQKVYKNIVINKAEIQNTTTYGDLMKLLQSNINNESIKDTGLAKLQIQLTEDSLKRQIPDDEDITKLSQIDTKLRLATTPDVFSNYTINFTPKGYAATEETPSAKPTEQVAQTEVKPEVQDAAKAVRDEYLQKRAALQKDFNDSLTPAEKSIKQTLTTNPALAKDTTNLLKQANATQADLLSYSKKASQYNEQFRVYQAIEQQKLANPTNTDVAIYARTKAGIVTIAKDLFNLPDEQANAVAEIYDANAQAWAARTGNSIADYYKQLGFKSQIEPQANEINILNQIIGEKGVSKLENSESILRDLEVAKQMFANPKYSPMSIRLATGWEMNKDGKWRYELNDGELKNIPENGSTESFLYKLYDNEGLYDAYPFLRRITLTVRIEKGIEFGGSYNGASDMTAFASNKEDLRNVIIHEIQHAIQHKEGFANGGNPDNIVDILYDKYKNKDKFNNYQIEKTSRWDSVANKTDDVYAIKDDLGWFVGKFFDTKTEAESQLSKEKGALAHLSQVYEKLVKEKATNYDAYHRLAGEVEARNAEIRSNFTQDERRATPLSFTQDVASESQIYLNRAAEERSISSELRKNITSIVNYLGLDYKQAGANFGGFVKNGMATEALYNRINDVIAERNLQNQIGVRLNKTNNILQFYNKEAQQGTLFQNDNASNKYSFNFLVNPKFEALQNKQVSKETLQNLLKQLGIKQYERDIATEVLDSFKDNKFNFNDFQDAVNKYVVPLHRQLDTNYANFGFKQIGVDFNKSEKESFGAVKLVFNDKLFGTVAGNRQFSHYKGNYSNENVFGHFRYFVKDGIFYIAEIQSDAYHDKILQSDINLPIGELTKPENLRSKDFKLNSQFEFYNNLYQRRIFNEAINYAKQQGYDKVRLASEGTVSTIEWGIGLTERGPADTEGLEEPTAFTPINIIDNYLAGSTIRYLNEEWTVINDFDPDEGDLIVLPNKDIEKVSNIYEKVKSLSEKNATYDDNKVAVDKLLDDNSLFTDYVDRESIYDQMVDSFDAMDFITTTNSLVVEALPMGGLLNDKFQTLLKKVYGDIIKSHKNELTPVTATFDGKESTWYDVNTKAHTFDQILLYDNGANSPKAAYNTLTNTVYALTNSDVTSPLHELAHSWEQQLTDTERKTVLDWANSDTWTRDTSERFASGFELYLSEGKAPTTALEKVFKQFAAWLADVVKKVQALFGKDFKLNDDMRGIYAKMLNGDLVKEEQKVEIAPAQQAEQQKTPLTNENNIDFIEQPDGSSKIYVIDNNKKTIPNPNTVDGSFDLQSAKDFIKEYNKQFIPAKDIFMTLAGGGKGVNLSEELRYNTEKLDEVDKTIRTLDESNKRNQEEIKKVEAQRTLEQKVDENYNEDYYKKEIEKNNKKLDEQIAKLQEYKDKIKELNSWIQDELNKQPSKPKVEEPQQVVSPNIITPLTEADKTNYGKISQIQKDIANGFYEQQIKDGKLTAEQVKAIIKSAGLNENIVEGMVFKINNPDLIKALQQGVPEGINITYLRSDINAAIKDGRFGEAIRNGELTEEHAKNILDYFNINQSKFKQDFEAAAQAQQQAVTPTEQAPLTDSELSFINLLKENQADLKGIHGNIIKDLLDMEDYHQVIDMLHNYLQADTNQAKVIFNNPAVYKAFLQLVNKEEGETEAGDVLAAHAKDVYEPEEQTPTEQVAEQLTPQEKYVHYKEAVNGEVVQKIGKIVEDNGFTSLIETPTGEQFDRVTAQLTPATKEEFNALKPAKAKPTSVDNGKYNPGDKVIYGQNNDVYTIEYPTTIPNDSGVEEMYYTTEEGPVIKESGIRDLARKTKVTEILQEHKGLEKRKATLERIAKRFTQLFPDIKYLIGDFDFNAPARFNKGVVEVNVSYQIANDKSISRERMANKLAELEAQKDAGMDYNKKLYADLTSKLQSGLNFYNVDEANAALYKDAFTTPWLKREAVAHEFMHPFILALKQSNSVLYNNLINELNKTQKPITDHVDNLIKSGTYSEENRNDEALAIYLGKSITDAFDKNGELKPDYVIGAKKRLFRRFLDWLTDIIDYLRGKRKTIKLEDFIKNANSDIDAQRDLIRSLIKEAPLLQELYSTKHKSDLIKTINYVKRTMGEAFNEDGSINEEHFNTGLQHLVDELSSKQQQQSAKAAKLDAKVFERPSGENPVYRVVVNGEDRFIQRQENLGGVAQWFEVVKRKELWEAPNGKTGTEADGLLGDSKVEALENLGKEVNPIKAANPEKLSQLADAISNFLQQKPTGRFEFIISPSEDTDVKFDETDPEHIKVYIDPDFADDITAPSTLLRYGQRDIIDNDAAEEFKNLVQRNYYMAGNYKDREASIGVKTLNPLMSLQDVSDFIVKQLNDKEYNIKYTNPELDAIDELEAYMELTEPEAAKIRERVVKRLQQLKDVAEVRLNNHTLKNEYNIVKGISLDESDVDFVLKYIERAGIGINLAWRKYNELRQDLQDPNLTQATLNRLNKDLDVVKQLVSFYDDFSQLYNNYEDEFNDEDLTKFRKSVANWQRLRDSMNETAINLAVKWMLPYAEKHNEYIKQQGYTDPKYFVTQKTLYDNFKYGADKDTNFITYNLGANVTSRDPVNAIFANIVADMLSINNINIVNNAFDVNEGYAQFLKDHNISANSSKAQVEYYKTHYMRHAEILQSKYDEKTNTYKDEYVKKLALHQEFYFDQYQKDLAAEREKYKNPRNSEEAEQFTEALNRWQLDHNYGKTEKYRNKQYTALQNDKFFKLLEHHYNESNAKYGENKLQYGIIPQKYDVGTIERLKRIVQAGKSKEGLREVMDKAQMHLAGIKKDNTSLNLDDTLHRVVRSELTQAKEERNLDLNLHNSIIDMITEATNYASLKEVQYNVENLRSLIEGNHKFNIDSRKIAKQDFEANVRNSIQLRNAKVEFKALNKLKDAGQPYDEARYKQLEEKIAKGAPKLKLWDRLAGTVKSSETARLNDQLIQFINDTFYGEAVEEEKLGKISLNKAAHYLSMYTSINNMAFNTIAGVSNVVIGDVQMMIEAHGGKYFNKKDLAWATADYYKNMANYLGDLKNPIKSKDTQISFLLDAIQGEIQDEFGTRISGNITRRMFNAGSLFFFTSVGEHQIQTIGMKAMLKAKKVTTDDGKTISLYDAYVKDANGRYSLRKDINFTNDDLQHFIRQLHGVNRSLNGNYSDLHKSTLQRKWYGTLMLKFRKYIYEAFRTRYSSEHTDFEKNTVEQGYMNFFLNDYLYKNFKNLPWNQKFAFISNYNKLNENQKYAMRKAGMELGIFLGAMILTMAFFGGGDPEHKKDLTTAQKTLLLYSLRLQNDLGMFHVQMPSEFVRQTKSPTASMTSIVSLANLLGQLYKPTEVYQQSGNGHEAGDNKLMAKFKKMLPVISKFPIDVDSKLGYFNMVNQNIQGVSPKQSF